MWGEGWSLLVPSVGDDLLEEVWMGLEPALVLERERELELELELELALVLAPLLRLGPLLEVEAEVDVVVRSALE